MFLPWFIGIKCIPQEDISRKYKINPQTRVLWNYFIMKVFYYLKKFFVTWKMESINMNMFHDHLGTHGRNLEVALGSCLLPTFSHQLLPNMSEVYIFFSFMLPLRTSLIRVMAAAFELALLSPILCPQHWCWKDLTKTFGSSPLPGESSRSLLQFTVAS